MCDGFKVSLVVEQLKPLKYGVMTYVDGHFLGKWMSAKAEHPEQRFLRRYESRIYSPAVIKKLEKAIGKRAVARDPRFQKTVVQYWPDWRSGRAAINHLCKVCDSITVLYPNTKETA